MDNTKSELALAALIVGLAEMTSFVLFFAMVLVWISIGASQ